MVKHTSATVHELFEWVGLALKELGFLAVIYEFYVSKYLNEFEGWLR